MDKNILWKFKWDCGRQGYLKGLFIAPKSEVESIIGKEIYFGEVLGKHSEIFGELEDSDLEQVDASDALIEELEKLFGATVSGYNPLNYLPEDEEYEDED